jgi:hypothetical protein
MQDGEGDRAYSLPTNVNHFRAGSGDGGVNNDSNIWNGVTAQNCAIIFYEQLVRYETPTDKV